MMAGFWIQKNKLFPFAFVLRKKDDSFQFNSEFVKMSKKKEFEGRKEIRIRKDFCIF